MRKVQVSIQTIPGTPEVICHQHSESQKGQHMTAMIIFRAPRRSPERPFSFGLVSYENTWRFSGHTRERHTTSTWITSFQIQQILGGQIQFIFRGVNWSHTQERGAPSPGGFVGSRGCLIRIANGVCGIRYVYNIQNIMISCINSE